MSQGRTQAPRRVAGSIFITLFITYAYFFQGGGWNPNGRFDQVRAIVESGSLSINAYMSYQADSDGAPFAVRRVTVPALERFPKDKSRFNTWDLTLHDGRFYPNKPPGTVLLAVPAYFVIHHVANALGGKDETAWGLTIRAYLMTLLSVSWVGALAGVVLFRTSEILAPSVETLHHATAGLTLGLGTLFLPFSTALMDHVVTAACLLIAFFLLLVSPPKDSNKPRMAALLGAGAVAGFAVLTNYTAALGLGILGLYALWRLRALAPLAAFSAGAALPLLGLALYHQACFGGPLVTANHGQPEGRFVTEGLWLGMMGTPDLRVIYKVLFSPYRGLFFSSPVLLFGAAGLGLLVKAGRRAEALTCVILAAAFVLLNASFNGWDGGNTFGPRYLLPAIPFLALGLAPALQRAPRITRTFALVSVAMMLFATFVTPRVHRDAANPYTDFLIPVALGQEVQRGATRFLGPVSANPAGVYGITPLRTFGLESQPAEWNAFNLGEFVWPQSWWSAAPLLAFLLLAGAWHRSLTALRPDRTPPAGLPDATA